MGRAGHLLGGLLACGLLSAGAESGRSDGLHTRAPSPFPGAEPTYFSCPAAPFAFSPQIFAEEGPLVLAEPADWSYTACPPSYTGRASLRGAVVLHVDPDTACPLSHAARAAAGRGAVAWLHYSSATAGLLAQPGKRRNEYSVREGVGDGASIAAASINSLCADALVERLREGGRRSGGAPQRAQVSPTPSQWEFMWRSPAWVVWQVVTAVIEYLIVELSVLRLHLLISPARADDGPGAKARAFVALHLLAGVARGIHTCLDPLGTGIMAVEWDGLLRAVSWSLHALGTALFFRHYAAMAVVVGILPRARRRLLLLLWVLLVLSPALLSALSLALAAGRLLGLRWARPLDALLSALGAAALPGLQALGGVALDLLIHRQMSSCPSPLFIELIMKAKRLNMLLLFQMLVAPSLAYLAPTPPSYFIFGLLAHALQVGAAYTMVSAVRPLGAGFLTVGPICKALSLAWRGALHAARRSPCAKMAMAVAPVTPGGARRTDHAGMRISGSRGSRGGFGSAAASSLPPHLRLGVTTAFLREFAQRHGCDPETKSYSMRELALRVTAQSTLSLAELSVEESAPDGYPRVGKASLFVSHAHACSYLRMVDAVEAHLELHGMSKEWTYVWVDIFSIRQQSLHSEIAHIGQVELELGHVVVILDPWDKPVCLTRVWCLYEIVHSLHPSVVLDLSVPRAERMRFVQAFANNLAAVEEQLCSFDARNAQVTVPQDKVVILSLIEEHFGGRLGYVEGEGLAIFNEETRAAIRAALAACSWDM